jgi:Holliday junction DNA helicase RuvA
MIAQLIGAVVAHGDRFLVLDVHGVGYKLFVSSDTLKNSPISDTVVTFATYLAVREDALELYGFRDTREQDFFHLLTSVPSIGPKSALAILSLAPPTTLQTAIANGDSSYLTRVSGIGKKTAEKIVVHLRDKIEALADSSESGRHGEAEAIEALQTLGYSLKEARDALQHVPSEVSDTSAKIKAALKLLGR